MSRVGEAVFGDRGEAWVEGVFDDGCVLQFGRGEGEVGRGLEVGLGVFEGVDGWVLDGFSGGGGGDFADRGIGWEGCAG